MDLPDRSVLVIAVFVPRENQFASILVERNLHGTVENGA